MLNPGDKVYRFEIRLDFLKDAVTTEENEYEVLATNEDFFVINDRNFKTLRYKIDIYGTIENFKKPSAFSSYFKSYYDYVLGYIYTDNKSKAIAHRQIKKAMSDYMEEKYGRFCKGIEMLKTLEEDC
jgi:hypothetical protein